MSAESRLGLEFRFRLGPGLFQYLVWVQGSRFSLGLGFGVWGWGSGFRGQEGRPFGKGFLFNFFFVERVFCSGFRV